MRFAIQGDLRGIFEDVLHSFARLRGTLEIVSRSDLLRTEHGVFRGHELLVGAANSFVHRRIVAQITFVSDEKDRHVMAVVLHFGSPFLQDTVQTVGRIEGETDQNHLSVRIAENTQSEERRRESTKG